jgi:uncharacterized RDD family membrane protein YckC
MESPTRVIGRRVVAFLVDGVLMWSVTLGAFFLLAHRTSADAFSSSTNTLNLTLGEDRWALEGGSAVLFSTAALAFGLAYLGVLPGLTGWTPGKRLADVRVVDAEGRLPGVGRGIVRTLLWVVDGFPYFVPALIGFLVAVSTQRHQRVGDQVAGTFVVRAGSVPPPEERPLAVDAPPASAAAGWYADPRGEDRLRYWDGQNWTAHTAP